MRVTMKQLSAGPTGVRLAGRSYDVDPAEGKVLVAAGVATVAEVEPEPAVEEDPVRTAEQEAARVLSELKTAEAPDQARRAVDPKQARRGRRGE